MKSIKIAKQKSFLESFLAESGYDISNAKDISGSSQSHVFLVNNERVFKVGPKEEMEAEQASYQKFRDGLFGYEKVFPDIQVLKEEDGIVIWESEMVGDVDLHEKIFEVLNDLDSYSELVEINELVLAKIGEVFTGSRFTDQEDAEEQTRSFFDELISALEKNLALGGFTEEEIGKYVPELIQKQSSFLDLALPSLLHRDLSVGNIMVSKQSRKVRFIDPRDQVPQLNEGRNFSTGGSIAFDLVGYYVSVLRKNRELEVSHSLQMPELIESIEKEISSYKDKGVFSSGLEKLCLAVWYSVYVGCRCDYCLAPERKWLYNEMVDNLKRQLDELIS